MSKRSDKILIFDGHCDTLIEILEGHRAFHDRVEPNPDSVLGSFTSQHLDLPRLIEAGYTAQIFACFTREQFLPSPTVEALRLAETLHQMVDDNSDQMIFATKSDHIEQAYQEDKIAGILSIEGGEPLTGDLNLFKSFYRLGLRHLGLTWDWRNAIADGLNEARSGGGLTQFGLDVLKTAEDLGVIIDIAHLAPAGVQDVFENTSTPIVNSHTGAKSVFDHCRNMSDQQMEWIAQSGGLVAVTYVPYFLSEKGTGATLDHVIDHIDHIVKTIGIDHVGIGSDFDGFEGVLEGMEDVTRVPDLINKLSERGYSMDDIRKIMGENYLRVFREVVG